MSSDEETVALAVLEEALNRGLELPRRYAPDELDFRRAAAYRLRLRGMTYEEIGAALGISHVTARKDVGIAKETAKYDTEHYDSKMHTAEMMQSYDDIIQTSWEIGRSTKDPDIRLKALQEVRKTINDKQKALMNAGMLGPQNSPVTNQINLNVIGHWSDGNVQEAISAVLGLQLTTPVLAPVFDEEAEIVETADTKDIDIEEAEPTEEDLLEEDDEYEDEDE